MTFPSTDILIILIALLLVIVIIFSVYIIIKQNRMSAEQTQKFSDGFEKILSAQENLVNKNNKEQRENIKLLIETLAARLKDNSSAQAEKIQSLISQIDQFGKFSRENFEAFEKNLSRQLETLTKDNSSKLDEIRQTVDEKLNSTLEKRLGQTFQAVSEGLEKVYKSIGEIKSFSTDISDLKNVLTNVKTRGIWGETQLKNLVEQILSPQQYSYDVETIKNSGKRVELGIKVPTPNNPQGFIWLPIDAKFPLEDYTKITSDDETVKGTADPVKALEQRIKLEAKSIYTKYIEPPYTTDFGIMFIPVEGLYAEILRIENLQDYIRRNYRIIVAGPTNLAAILSSLRLGFRTFAIEKRTHEIWNVLLEIKNDFSKFGELLEKTEQKLEQASKSISEANKKTKQISGKLEFVDTLPDADEKK